MIQSLWSWLIVEMSCSFTPVVCHPVGAEPRRWGHHRDGDGFLVSIHRWANADATEFRQQTPRHDGVTGRGSRRFRRCAATFARSPPWHCGFPLVPPPESWCTLGFNIQPVPSTSGTDKDLAARNGCPPLLRTEQGGREHVSLRITVCVYLYISINLLCSCGKLTSLPQLFLSAFLIEAISSISSKLF